MRLPLIESIPGNQPLFFSDVPVLTQLSSEEGLFNSTQA